MSEEKYRFQTETAELLKMMIGSVYSNRDIFLRELISNASDALDKRRIETLKNSELAENKNPEIKIEVNSDEKTLTVSDNGIGMSKADLIEFLGTIAKSGTKDFLKASKDFEANQELIGQFGVGFYSVFMVADKVEVTTRKLGTNETFKFTSDGSGEFIIEEVSQRSECGTDVKLYIRENKNNEDDKPSKNYLEEWTLREIITKYSDFISWPIKFKDNIINSQKAIWQKPEKEVTDEEYKEFYKHLTHDWNDPLEHIKINAEGGTNFKGLLFIPSQAPFDLFMNPDSGGISLYINRVFIMNDCKNLIPNYMRFIKGVIDSEDLPLNISREILQDEPIIKIIRRSTVRKIFTELKKLLNKDREKYIKFWNAFGKILKEGVVQDHDHVKNILEISLFKTTFSDEYTTLEEYKSRMKPEQQGIYCLAGRDSISALKASPKLEPFINKGYEVLLMPDPVDEVILNQASFSIPEDFAKLLNISDDNVSAETEAEKKDSEKKIKSLEKDFKPLKDKILEILSDKLEDVKLSLTLTNSPACLKGGMSVQMQNILSSLGQPPTQQKRILELNAENELIKKLITLAKDKDERIPEILRTLYDQAVILEGAVPEDLTDFTKRINNLMSLALGDK